MNEIDVTLFEVTAEEVKSLPKGFRVLEYDLLYESVQVIRARIDRVKHGGRYRYLLYKKP